MNRMYLESSAAPGEELWLGHRSEEKFRARCGSCHDIQLHRTRMHQDDSTLIGRKNTESQGLNSDTDLNAHVCNAKSERKVRS